MELSLDIKVSFRCKLCETTFSKLGQFFRHKMESHSSEFRKTKCVVFEEIIELTENQDRESQKEFKSATTPADIDTNSHSQQPHSEVSKYEFSALNVSAPLTVAVKTVPEIVQVYPSEVQVQLDADALPRHFLELKSHSGSEYSSDHQSVSQFDAMSNEASMIDVDGDSDLMGGPHSESPSTTDENVHQVEVAMNYSTTNSSSLHRDSDGHFLRVRQLFSKSKPSSIHNQFHQVQTNSNYNHNSNFPYEDLRPFKCPQPKCSASFKNKWHLVRHCQTMHSDARPFRCPQLGCFKAFKTKANMKLHYETHAANEVRPVFLCQICNNSFSTKFNLNRHYSAVHSQEKPFKCTMVGCTADFKKKSSLAKHEQSHWHCTGIGIEPNVFKIN